MVAALGLLAPLVAEQAAPAIDVEVQSRFTASSPLGPDGGRVSQQSNLVDLFLPVAGSSGFGMGLDLIAQHFDFHFRDVGESFPGGSAPLGAANIVTLQPAAMFTPTPRWSFVGSGTVQYAGGGNAPRGDSTLLSGSVGALYQHAADRKLGLGLQVAERMRAPPLILPFPLIDWRISDRWSLTAMNGTSGRLSCRVTAALSVVGQLEFQSQDLRLKSSASIPSGILRYEAFPLSVGIEYRPNKHLTVSATGGAAIAQHYRFEDARGHLLRTSAATPRGSARWISTMASEGPTAAQMPGVAANAARRTDWRADGLGGALAQDRRIQGLLLRQDRFGLDCSGHHDTGTLDATLHPQNDQF